jgi:hypothetical protein
MDGQKCDHTQCTCYVDLGAFFCSDRCREQAAADPDAPPHDSCNCRHDECENSL